MVAITLATSATLRSRVLEAAILELATWITLQERVSIQNPASKQSFRTNYSSFTGQYNSAFSLEATYNLINGINTPVAVNYFQNVTYSSGATTNGTLTGNNPMQDFVTLVSLAENLEQDISRNSGNRNYANIAFLSNPFRFEGSFTLEASEVINTNGSPSFVAKAYLT